MRDKALAAILRAMENARAVYETDRNPFDAGRYEGLKEAVELFESITKGA